MYLNVHSYYSLRYGTMSIANLVHHSAGMGIQTMALTDINNTTGVFDFYKECKKAGIKPVVGIEFRNGNELLYVALARNNKGFQNINEFLSSHNLSETPLPAQPPWMEDVFIIFPYHKKKYEALQENEYLGITADVLNLIALRNQQKLHKFVVLHPATFVSKRGYQLHCHLRAIDNNILLSRLEPGMIADPLHSFISPTVFKQLYKDFPEAIRNTEQLLDSCEIYFDFQEPKNKQTFTSSKYADLDMLQKLALQGIESRYGKDHAKAHERVRKELLIVDKLGFSSYFLIAWDMVRFSMSKGFYHVGRGSGANSIIAYCLYITDVDPLELDLYFERFLNPKRSAPPDFDIDYSWKERNEVLDYLFDKHGYKNVALLGTISSFKRNSIIRELGKAYGLPKREIDVLADHPQHLDRNNEIANNILKFGELMVDFPNIRSIHAGGILIGERPISYYSPVDLPPKGYPTVQWDMYVAEDIHFEKLDVLSQRGIGHIKDCADIVFKNHKIKIDVHDIATFKQDEKVKEQLKSGDTIGCFYVESPAMRQLLKKLHCDNYTQLVAASSIIRPGVASSGMMGQFIYRFHNPDKFEYLHPVMKEQLGETYGVMVYQEDVLKICHHYAGLDLGDADVLRRAMSGKYRSKNAFEELVKKFFEGAKALGRPEKITEEIWRQTSSFGGYSFCKAHSASFAVESFQSLYLKAYYPLDFMVAVINNFGGFYTSWVYIKEAMKAGANIHLPCINRSGQYTTIYQHDIFLGFTHIQNLETELTNLIERERLENGIYKNMSDFVKRTDITREQLFVLIRLGALRVFGKKKALMWEATLHISKESRQRIQKNTAMLFELPLKEFELPALLEDLVEDAYDEIELLGFPLSLNEFDLLDSDYRGDAMAENLLQYQSKKVKIVGNLVATKDVRAKNGKVMKFGTFLDPRSNFFDTVHFTKSLEQFPFTGKGVYLIEGKVVSDFGVPSLEVEKLQRLPYRVDPRN